MDHTGGSDRHRQEVVPHTLQARCRVKKLHEPMQAVEIADLSLAGVKIFFFTGNLREHDLVELELLPAGAMLPFTVTAAVKWISALPVAGRYPGGLVFLNLSREQRSRLEQYLARHHPR